MGAQRIMHSLMQANSVLSLWLQVQHSTNTTVLLSACSSAQPLGTAEAWHALAQDSAQSAGCYVSASALMSVSGLLTWQLSMGACAEWLLTAVVNGPAGQQQAGTVSNLLHAQPGAPAPGVTNVTHNHPHVA